MKAIDSSVADWLFIASRSERFANRIVSEIPKHSRNAQLWWVDGTAHATDIMAAQSRVESCIVAWVLDRLSDPRRHPRVSRAARKKLLVTGVDCALPWSGTYDDPAK